MKNVISQAFGISLGSVIYDLMTKPGWTSVDFKKAVFMFAFALAIFWLLSKKSANRKQEVSA